MFLDLNQPKHAHVDARLRAESILWLGTVRPDGRPHLVPVWFLWDGESISIYSQPDAQKLRNLAANPAVTVALEALGEGSDVVIIEGEARVGAAADVPAVAAAYTDKYAAAIADLGYTSEGMLGAYSRLIRVTPRRLLAWAG